MDMALGSLGEMSGADILLFCEETKLCSGQEAGVKDAPYERNCTWE